MNTQQPKSAYRARSASVSCARMPASAAAKWRWCTSEAADSGQRGSGATGLGCEQGNTTQAAGQLRTQCARAGHLHAPPWMSSCSAAIAASRHTAASSAPVYRGVLPAMAARSTSAASGMPRLWICGTGKWLGWPHKGTITCTAGARQCKPWKRTCRACRRPASSGGGTYRMASKRPGLQVCECNNTSVCSLSGIVLRACTHTR